ncbi:unnamed protein product, partial [Meganyctiphanes norvegica]
LSGLLLISLAVLGGSSATLLVEDNVLSTLGKNVFEFDHYRPDFQELSRHPYMRSYNFMDNDQESIEHLLSNSFSKSRSRRSTFAENRVRRNASFVSADDKDLTLDLPSLLANMPNLDLEVKFKIPLLQIYESTFINFNIPMNFNIPLFQMSHITARNWNDEIQPALDDLEGLVSMLGLDGRSCVLRAVCEIAETPMIRPEGIVGEMLEIFVNYLTRETPESNEIDGDEAILSRSRRDYTEASLNGRDIGGCVDHYPTCPISLFNIRAATESLQL